MYLIAPVSTSYCNGSCTNNDPPSSETGMNDLLFQMSTFWTSDNNTHLTNEAYLSMTSLFKPGFILGSSSLVIRNWNPYIYKRNVTYFCFFSDDLPNVGFYEAVHSDQHVIGVFLWPAFGDGENRPIDILGVCHYVHVVGPFCNSQIFTLLEILGLGLIVLGWLVVLSLRKMFLKTSFDQYLKSWWFPSCNIFY